MKNHLKLYLIVPALIIAASVLFIFAKKQSDDKPETIMVKMVRGNLLEKTTITVIYGGDKKEKIKASLKETDTEVINTIQKLNSEGYKVISQTSFSVLRSNDANSIESKENQTWVLVRK